MKKWVLASLIVLILGGCAGKASQETVQKAVQETIQETAQETAQQTETLPMKAVKKSIVETTVAETASVDSFDAAQMVEIEDVKGGIKVTYHQLPQNQADMEALVAEYGREDERRVCAYFHAALVRYPESADDCYDMLDVLRGPQPMSEAEKSFMKERFSDKLYLPRTYFEGATPKNEYQPDEPWEIIIYDDPVKPPDGYAYTMVASGGADNKRRIVMRIKDGQKYLWEYNGALLSVRLPASEDPWV